MKVLFDMVHPADVHFFRYAIRQLQQRGDKICVTSREKDVTRELLDDFSINHTRISRKGDGAIGLFLELLARDINLYRVARTFRPDIIVRIMSRVMCAAPLFMISSSVPDRFRVSGGSGPAHGDSHAGTRLPVSLGECGSAVPESGDEM